MNLFALAAVVLTGLAVATVVWPLMRKTGDKPAAPVAALALGIALPAAVLVIYLSASNHEWSAAVTSNAGTGIEAGGIPNNIAEMVSNLENRLRSEPDDVSGWLMLGRTYAQLQQPVESRRAYSQALALEPSTEAKLGLAEADIIIDRTNLTGEAGRLIEEVLAVEPQNPKALFYGGMVSMANNDIDTFRARWQLLLAMSPPDEIRAVIETQLINAGVTLEPNKPPEQTGPLDEGINVNVSVAEGLSDRIKPGAVLFLVARAPDRPGPPVAVVRREASQLPAALNLSDRDAMMAGNPLSALSRVQLIARITNSGEPVAQPGDLFGEAQWMMNDASGEGISIVIDKIVD